MVRPAQPPAPCKASYSFGNLWTAPKRVFRAPTISSVDSAELQRIGLVRKLFKTPIFQMRPVSARPV